MLHLWTGRTASEGGRESERERRISGGFEDRRSKAVFGRRELGKE